MTRPIIDKNLHDLAGAVGATVLPHVDAERVLFVAGAARLSARASIRPLSGPGRPHVEIGGVRMFYEICLRPRFFLEASTAEQIAIVIHELWHASDDFDGTLERERRHGIAGTDVIESAVEDLVARFMAEEVTAAGRFLEHKGEVSMRAWLNRPPSRIPEGSSMRTRYDERDLFLAVVGGKGTRDG